MSNEISSEAIRKREDWIDIAKGIGIFLVVYAHAGSPFKNYMYLFHMPFFFLVSGYLYRSSGSLKDYVIRKVKGLYIPFVGWNIIIILARMLSRGIAGKLTGQKILHHLKHILKVLLTLDKEGDYLGATWFIGALFAVSVVYKVLDTYIQDGAYKRSFITVICIISGVSAYFITLPYMQSRVLILSIFFAMGHLARLHWEEFEKCFSWISGVVALILLAWIGKSTSAGLGKNEYNHFILFLFTSCTGSFATLWLARVIDQGKNPILQSLKRCLIWWGKESIDIVIWQFVAFRLVAAFQFYLEGEPIRRALKERIYNTSGAWWIAYTVVGIFVPLLWGWILKQGFWGRILKKLYLVR